MAKYKGTDGSVIEVGDASNNQDLVRGRTLVPDTTALSGAIPTANPNNQTPGGFGLPNTNAPVVSPIQRTIDPAADAATTFLDRPFVQPETASQIADRKRKEAQGFIDATEAKYQSDKAIKERTGRERLSMDNAVSVLSGLTGSTVATNNRKTVLDANDKEMQALNNEKMLTLQKLYMDISKDAETEARTQLQDATTNAEAIVTRRKEVATKAIETITNMAKGGLVDFESFKNSPANAQVYQHALDAYGGSEDALRSAFVLNRPKEQIIGTPTRIGNKYVQAYSNPITGKVSYETIDMPVDLPTEYKNFQKLGDNLVAIPDGWDGDTSKLKTIAGEPSTMERLQRRSLQLDIDKKQQEVNANAGAPAKAADQKAQALSLAKELRGLDENGLPKKVVGKSSAVGASAAKFLPFGQSLGLQGDRSAFEAKVDTLKSNLTLDNLKLLKGAMSDKDLLFLNSIGSSLNTNMSQTAFDAELDKIITKLGGASAPATSDLQTGEILVKDKATGQLGAIPEGEFDNTLYERQ